MADGRRAMRIRRRDECDGMERTREVRHGEAEEVVARWSGRTPLAPLGLLGRLVAHVMTGKERWIIAGAFDEPELEMSCFCYSYNPFAQLFVHFIPSTSTSCQGAQSINKCDRRLGPNLLNR